MPSSDRSSWQKRCGPSARSRITRRVHLPEMISAQRLTGHGESDIALRREYSANALRTEVAGSGPDDLLDAARAPPLSVEHELEIVGTRGGLEGGLDRDFAVGHVVQQRLVEG